MPDAVCGQDAPQWAKAGNNSPVSAEVKLMVYAVTQNFSREDSSLEH